MQLHPAEFWHMDPAGAVICDLCPHHCHLKEGATGRCHVREVQKGRLVARSYGLVSSAGLDPIEKKPLYHFRPGSDIFSIGSWGCNFGCLFCQNWSISQELRESEKRITPERIVEEAVRSDCGALAFTYNEPTVGFEYVRDCARLAADRQIANVLVTNGYIEIDPASVLLPLVSAVNIDIKSMQESFYRDLCKGRLAPVLSFARQVHDAGIHVEITNLVIPGHNDTVEEQESLASWIAEHLGPTTPLHLSAYRPMYRMQDAPTPLSLLLQARDAATRHLYYVYLGNVSDETGSDTRCPGCKNILVHRSGYRTSCTGIENRCCKACQRQADLVW